MGIVFAFLNYSAVVKVQAVVVLNGSELLVCNLHRAIRESVDLIRLQKFIHLGCCLIKASCLNQGAFFVDKIKVEQHALAFSILPWFDLCFFNDPCLYYPVCTELVQGFNRHVAVSWNLL